MCKGKLVFSCGRNMRTGLWLLPIAERDTKQREINTAHTALEFQMLWAYAIANTSHMAATSVHTLLYKQQQLKYMHQSFFQHADPNVNQGDSERPTYGIPMHDG